MTQVKCFDILEKRPDELEKVLNDLHEELIQLKISKKNSNHIRKSIANVHIVRNENIKDNLRKFYENNRYQPTDLRTKQTRAMRRRLTENEQTNQLTKTRRKQASFPNRTFAIKD